MVIANVAISIHKPTLFVHQTTSLINLLALVGEYGSPCPVVVEVSLNHQWVEVELLHTERSRHLPPLVHVFLREHLLVLIVLKDVAVDRIQEIPALVDSTAVLVDVLAVLILQQDDATLLVPVELSQDVALVEVPLLRIWRHLHHWLHLVELL